MEVYIHASIHFVQLCPINAGLDCVGVLVFPRFGPIFGEGHTCPAGVVRTLTT